MAPRTILAIGDPHFKTSNTAQSMQLVHDVDGFLARFHPEWLVILGDILHDHSKADLRPLRHATDWLKGVSKKIRTFVLIGNHDRLNNSDFLSDYHPFPGLEGWPNLEIICKTKLIDGILFVPYVKDGRFQEAIETILPYGEVPNKVEMGFAHQEIQGAPLGFKTSMISEAWPANYPLIVSGHIHTACTVGKNWVYSGSAFSHDTGELDKKSVVFLLREETNANASDNANANASANLEEGNRNGGIVGSWRWGRIPLTVVVRKVEKMVVAEAIARLGELSSMKPNELIQWRVIGTSAELAAAIRRPEVKEALVSGRFQWKGETASNMVKETATPLPHSTPKIVFSNVMYSQLGNNTLAQQYWNAFCSEHAL
jgi:DNA repair exonuclease SbcCD nuclease subunit